MTRLIFLDYGKPDPRLWIRTCKRCFKTYETPNPKSKIGPCCRKNKKKVLRERVLSDR